MFKYRVKFVVFRNFLCALPILCCQFLACISTNSKPLLISFSADSTSIEFSNIDRPGLLQLQNMTTKDSVLSELIAVLQTPSEKNTIIKETPISGKFILTDSNIVFTPYIPFKKGNDYLVITYLNARFGSVDQILKSQLNTTVKPTQIFLTR